METNTALKSYSTGEIDADDAAELDFDFAIDTALSWDGAFPDPGENDFVVYISSIDGDDATPVLVSSRYVGAVDHANAAGIALDAFAERKGYDTDDNGEILPITNEMGTGIPCWVDSVEKVVA